MRLLGTVLAAACSAACAAMLAAPPSSAAPDRPERLEVQQTVVDPAVGFRGLDALDRRTAFVSGARSLGEGAVEGVVYRTTDGGRTYDDVTPPGAAGLQFRDVEVLDRRTVVVLAIGEGDASRIYRSTDGGARWTEAYRATDPRTFLDCLDFYDDGRTGLVMGDPVDGRFQILRTDDRGASWRLLPSTGMPEATGEAGFAASGDCLVVDRGTAWFGSGGADSRIYRSTDRGRTWTASPSTIPAGDAAGVFGLAFDGRGRGVAVGGDFSEPADGVDASAVLTRRGWVSGGDLTHLAEDAAHLPGGGRDGRLLATGESGDVAGTSWSDDGGRSWTRLPGPGFHTLDCTPSACFAAGGGGRVAVVRLRR